MKLIKNYPILYSSKNNIKRFWHIQIFEKSNYYFISTSYGLVNGKITKSIPKKINNSSQKNKLSIAITQANYLWKKKKESGFFQNNNLNKVNLNKFIKPMKAHKLNNHSNKIIYPCLVQHKLDGFRCLANKNNNNIYLYSKNMKEFSFLNHIKNEINIINNLNKSIYLDGELYNKNLSLSEISSIVMLKKLNKLNINKMNKIFFYIFDMFDLQKMDLTFIQRFNILKKLFKNHKFKYLKLVSTVNANNINDVNKLNDKYISQGYEGIIVRNKNGLYKLNSKSYDVLRTKEFKKDTFKIIGAKSGTGSQENAIIWICKCNKSNNTFSVIPLGSISQRINTYKDYLNNKNKYLNKNAVIKYLDLDKNKCIIRNPILLKILI